MSLIQRPFARLVQLFAARIFHGGGDTDAEELDFSMGLILALLALPGAFVSVILFEKYGSLLQWMRGETNFNPLSATLPDEYFFIVLSMVVTGAVAVWKWDSIFPDRRDYMNLVPLPISMGTIFLANLVALLLLVLILAVDVNAVSSILFPFEVSAAQEAFWYFARFAVVHSLSVLLASIFTFLAVFSVLGLVMAILPYSIFRRISTYLRVILVVSLLILLLTCSTVPVMLGRLQQLPLSWIRFLPSSWFLGLCQWLRGQSDPAFASLGHSAIFGVGSVLLIAIFAYTLSYRRYFVRIAEMSQPVPSSRRGIVSAPSMFLDRFVLRTPFQRGCSRFIWKTLFRSERHSLVLAGCVGLGLVLASQALLSAQETASGKSIVSADALSVPLILAFCIVVGLRLVFEIPVELRSNWIFRLTLDGENHESEAVARKAILSFVVPWVLLGVPPAYAYFNGWTIGLLHTALVLVWSFLLADAVLVRFRKLPFTCSFPVFRQHSILIVLACVMGFVAFAIVTSELESWALSDPVRMFGFIPIVGLAWYLLRRVRLNTMEIERRLIFEELPTETVEVLHLSD